MTWDRYRWHIHLLFWSIHPPRAWSKASRLFALQARLRGYWWYRILEWSLKRPCEVCCPIVPPGFQEQLLWSWCCKNMLVNWNFQICSGSSDWNRVESTWSGFQPILKFLGRASRPVRGPLTHETGRDIKDKYLWVPEVLDCLWTRFFSRTLGVFGSFSIQLINLLEI